MNKKDMKLIGACAVFAFIALIVLGLTNRNKASEIGVVEYQEEIILTFELDKNDIYEFEGSYGVMHLEVKDGSFHVFDVECPNHNCEQMGWHDKDSMTPIVCLPNEVVIYAKER